jgi:N-acyl-L-homoserine lactone synthetase
MATEITRSNSADLAGTQGSFFDEIARLSDRIDYRIADSDEQREAIFRLRHQAYVRDGTILPIASGKFSDRYDETGNFYLFGLHVDDELASSVRLHVPSRERPDAPSFKVFAEVLQPELNAGKVIIDATHFVADKNAAQVHRGISYATFRLCMLAARYFNADYILAAVSASHRTFYRRAFNYQLICEPRPYPLLAKPLGLMRANFPSQADQLGRRYPFFRSSFFERRMLFERPIASLQHNESMVLAETTPFIQLNPASAARHVVATLI